MDRESYQLGTFFGLYFQVLNVPKVPGTFRLFPLALNLTAGDLIQINLRASRTHYWDRGGSSLS